MSQADPQKTSPSGGPDVNIPPPSDSNASVQTAPQAPLSVPLPYAGPAGMSSTTMIIALVLVVIWAGILIFLKRLVTQSLVGQFADLGRSRAAGTTLYLFLLVLGATVIVCALGGFWQILEVIIPAAVLNLVLFVLFLFSFSSARASRQRRSP